MKKTSFMVTHNLILLGENMKKQHVKLYSTILLTGWLASNLGSGISISAEIIKQVLTLENAQKISEGKITLENRLVDSLLFGSNLHPDQDNDHDGLTNKHELYTYKKITIPTSVITAIRF
ncbi:TPA: hypothetical protein U1151_002025 [Streptococcus suis]|nr:hypothetical protein [Streptococcus suis]HEM4953851.1 hypothetical protein [Streptococcus suis]